MPKRSKEFHYEPVEIVWEIAEDMSPERMASWRKMWDRLLSGDPNDATQIVMKNPPDIEQKDLFD